MKLLDLKMNLKIDNSITDIIDEFNVVCYKIDFLKEYNPLVKTKEIDELLSSLYQELNNKYNYDEITSINVLKETRDGYKALKKDPSHTRPAPEALLRRVLKQGKLYRIGDVVDLGNIISLYTLKSVCIVDASKVKGDIVIRKGTTFDSYEGINRGLINTTNLPVYCDDLGAFGCPTSDTLRTKVTDMTKEIIVMIINFKKIDNSFYEKIVTDLFTKYTKIKKIEKIK